MSAAIPHLEESSRICVKHGSVCEEDLKADAVICNGRKEGERHTLRPGQWDTVGRSGISGRALVHQRVREALRTRSGNPRHAAEELVRVAQVDPRLREALLSPYMEDAARAAVARVTGAAPLDEDDGEEPSRGPRPIHRAPSPAPPAVRAPRSTTDDGLKAMAATTARDLLRLEVAHGIHLGDLTGSEILDHASLAATTARESAVRSRFLRLVAQRVPAQRHVSAVLQNADLNRIHAQAETDALRVWASVGRRLNRAGLALEAAE